MAKKFLHNADHQLNLVVVQKSAYLHTECNRLIQKDVTLYIKKTAPITQSVNPGVSKILIK